VEVITEQSLMGFSDAEPDPAIRREGTTKEETMCLICGLTHSLAVFTGSG
jgi:hypothetical protein